MRLALLIVGAVVAQGRVAYHEDDPQQDDATDQQWFEEARKAGLHSPTITSHCPIRAPAKRRRRGVRNTSPHEEIARIARRVFGGAHPTTVGIEESLRNARAVLRAREAA